MRTILNKYIALALIMLIHFPVLADDLTSRTKLAERLIELMNVGQAQDDFLAVIEENSKSLTKMLGDDTENTSDKNNSLSKDLKQFMLDTETVKKEMVSVYADVFTAQELSELIAFYESDIGKKLLEKQPEIASKLVAFSAKRTAPLLNQLMSTFEKQKTKTLKIKSVEELNKITLEKAAEVGTLNLRGVRLGSDFNQLPKFKNVWRLLLTKADITDSKLKIVLALPKLTILSLVMTEITDDGLKNLENTSLNRLFLRQTKITDSGLASLAKIPSLKRLDLRYTNVTDDGLKNIRELELESLLLSGQNISGKGLAYLDNRSKLKYLTLSGKNVTDESISALKGLESLSSLDLSYSQVGDKGISNLPELPNLKKLVLKGLQITPSKITALKERFPDLKIIF